MNKNITILLLIALLFFLGIISISYTSWDLLASIILLLVTFYITNKNNRFVTSLYISFLINLFLYQLTTTWIDGTELSKELKVLLNRGMLILVLVGLISVNLTYRIKVSLFHHMANWNSSITLPFHSIKLKYFIGIGIIISGIIFTPFIVGEDPKNIKSLLLFAFLFSIINAVLEETLWRGVMLSNLKESSSVQYALIVTSIGFGLLHLLVGISFTLSISFIFAGLFYGYVVLKTNSIYPAILFHFVINIGMVLSGMII